jgi:arsenate reductase
VQDVDYTMVPPNPGQLKDWSVKLGESGQSLVRRTDPLFFALQLDDRFITENEFWTAVSLHPRLINGPVVSNGDKVAICKTPEEVRHFMGLDAIAAPKPKSLSPWMAAMIRGEAVPPRPLKKEADPPAAEPKPVKPAVLQKPAAVIRGESVPPRPLRKEADMPAAEPKPAKPAVKQKPAAVVKPVPAAKKLPKAKAVKKKIGAQEKPKAASSKKAVPKPRKPSAAPRKAKR